MTGIVATGRRRLAGRWAQPIYRSGYLLVLNAVITAVFGLGFWLIAARLYPPAVIGVNSTAISAMMLIAGVAQLNLMSSLLRFVPTAGRGAPRMVVWCFSIGATLSALVATVFVAGASIWTPALVPLIGRPFVAVSFVVAAAGWAVMVMQGCVFVAVGHAAATTITNQLFNFLKLLLLFPLVLLLPDSGVWFSWASATAVTVAVGGWFLFRRAMVAFVETPVPVPVNVPSVRDLARFAVPDYVAALAWIACTSLVPILVFNLSDARHAAVFALGWSICITLYTVPTALGQSLVAYGVREPSRLPEHHRKILVTSLGLLAPAVAVLVLFTPQILAPFGQWYATVGSTTVRLLSLSAMPNAVVALEVSRARADRRMAAVISILGGLSVLVLGLTWFLVPHLGIAGGGVAWLVGEVVVASGVGMYVWKRTKE